ncbi:hypothetical protein TREMEDRAFT_33014 [Tremella mesenterica DSM 1558]|uniref:uncharacterized protein n=1 Tax=Tremella mesenterica (strain ATCC 24925 / CBS 8224 / DSM 1558 / NBRC 9311 / NRRL Y-6157 / RJB 2259-6 / UBC 559-6) TaxID=578456 RepID=UPI0003F492A6|nr:uncharacterized protein TREMEDRAFT_33014 [Tremella mesenterica DSM 1558]EIW67850.1 hypothetical protein TREMEDRAFT_33014 [Tremella mesenterica DSM 1558]
MEIKKKEPRKKKEKPWPPIDLQTDLHPPRYGHPPYDFGTGIIPSKPISLGAHVSIAGGPAGALLRAGLAGANGLGMFVKSQRQWKSNPYEEETVKRFKELLRTNEEGGYGHQDVLVHGSYLINLGNPDPEKWKTSYECFKDDISRCHQLGLRLYNWHPGSTVGACSKEESFGLIAKAINLVHEEVPEVITVIENMANAGSNIIGTSFSDLSSIISLVEDKSRVRVCLDTCHLFAAGYDLRTPEAYAETMTKFGDEIGWEYIGGMHLNDSKADLGGNKDLHENIGLGKIGLSAFRQIMRDQRLQNIPMVLETPAPEKALEAGNLAIWTKEIQLLYEIQGISDDEWVNKEEEIMVRWRKERDEINPPKEKPPKGAKAPKGKKGKKDKEESEEED